ncbi:MAG TPA: cation diffusion facilitator family transporter [Bdellovibrionota bacterium]|nr:cation diffusion facilitator family transporter [Bdellovibrionota bacterium]
MAHRAHLIDPMREKARHRLGIAAGITFVLFIVEIAGGLISNSLALLSDAGHMLADLFSLVLTLVSIWWATKPATHQKTYGYYRVEILVTLVNGVLMLFVAFQILWEAAHRLLHVEPVRLDIMLPIAAAGLIVNLISMFLLRHQMEHLATRSAFLHVLGDTLSSVAVVLAAGVMYVTNWLFFDPLLSALLAGWIAVTSVRLLRTAVDVLLEASPSHISLDKVRNAILEIDGVEDVHDLHVWTISSGFYAASAHILVHDMRTKESESIIHRISDRLRSEFSVTHATIQVAALQIPAKIQKPA